MMMKFWKLTGAGNDFVGFDNWEGRLAQEQLPIIIRHICHRRFGIGADGVIIIEKGATGTHSSFRMRYFNADGSEAGTCGNGARCIARLAHTIGHAPADMLFDTRAGLYHAVVHDDLVSIDLPPLLKPELDIRVSTSMFEGNVDSISPGVPHIVIRLEDIDKTDVFGIGRSLRYCKQFDPPGTNVNFIKVRDNHTLEIRTYERGVENETLACGTGSLSAAVCCAVRHLVVPPVNVITRSGIPLSFDFKIQKNSIDAITMTGPADIVFSGEIDLKRLMALTPDLLREGSLNDSKP